MRYLPTADGAAAGGDFYDAMELSGGRLGIAVGDVVGHGPGAAAAMGQLRSALRAYALEGRAPARVLQLLSRYADGVPGARGATVVYAVIDPAAREVRYAPAGHPPPLLLAPGEAPRYLNGARGVPLDRALGHVYTDATASAGRERDADPVLRRRDRTARRGARRRAGAAGGAPRTARWPPRRWRTSCWRPPIRAARDDVALLVARVHVPEITPLRLWFAARPDQLAVVREAMRSWLATAGVDRGDAEMLVLAAGELCANAVEHAYPEGTGGAVEVAAARELGRHGDARRARPRTLAAAAGRSRATRGRGLGDRAGADDRGRGRRGHGRHDRDRALPARRARRARGGRRAARSSSSSAGPRCTVARITGEIDEFNLAARRGRAG